MNNLEDFKEVISWITCVISIILLIPQTFKSFKENTTEGLSIYTLIIQFISSIMWVIYSVVLNEISMIISMSVYFILSLALLILKIYHEYKTKNNLNTS